jgi:hypothetical protein
MNSLATATRRICVLAGAAGAAGLITACGSGAPAATATGPAIGTAPAASSSSATTPATSPAQSSPAQVSPASCVSSDLQAKLGASQGAAGTIYQVVALTNTSDATCTLYGYPGVSFVSGIGGKVIGAPAVRNPAIGDALVSLAPGGQASTLVGVEDVGALPQSKCQPGKANWLQIYAPGDTGALYVQYSSQVCTNASEKFMTDTAVRSGASGTS